MKKIAVLLACLFLAGCQIEVKKDGQNILDALLSNEGHVYFGTGYNDSGVTGKTNVFNKNKDMFIEIDTPNEFKTTKLTLTVYKSGKNGYEEIVGRESFDVDPSWTMFWAEFTNPNESGKYIVRIYKGSEKIAEGSFQIK